MNCFSCGGYGGCDAYAVAQESRVCYYNNIATIDLIKFNNGNPFITLYDQMRIYFKNDKDSLDKLSRLEEMIKRK